MLEGAEGRERVSRGGGRRKEGLLGRVNLEGVRVLDPPTRHHGVTGILILPCGGGGRAGQPTFQVKCPDFETPGMSLKAPWGFAGTPDKP